MRSLAIIAALAALPASLGPAAGSGVESARIAFAEARAALAAHDDGFFIDNHPNAPRLLRQQWRVVEDLAARDVTMRPDVRDSDLKADLARLDTQLSVNVVRLDDRTRLISLQLGEQGDVFIVHRQRDRFALAWRAGDLKPAFGGPLHALSAWREDAARNDCREGVSDAHWGDCGALYPAIGKLPRDASGLPRFFVQGSYAEWAGGTVGAQISVWKWNGETAIPLLIQLYSYSIDQAAVVRSEGDLLRVPVRDDFKTFFSCGECLGRSLTWTFRLTPNGVQDLGKASDWPEVDFIDDLYDDALHHRPLTDRASPATQRVVAEQVSGADLTSNAPALGMGGWEVSRDRRRVCVSVDVSGVSAVYSLKRTSRGLFAQSASRLRGGASCGRLWRGSFSGQ